MTGSIFKARRLSSAGNPSAGNRSATSDTVTAQIAPTPLPGSTGIAAYRRGSVRGLLLGALLLALAACAGEGGGSTTAIAPEPAASVAVTTTSAPDAGGESDTTAPNAEFEPAYDVFLAAVAEAIADTRFAEVPFDEPEVTAAVGLAICESIAAGETPDQIIAEFVGDLAGGEPDQADSDQVQLTGAILGAAETALCPSAR